MAMSTKQRIADAALEQFHLKGFNGTSVQDLVGAAGVPKGTFYNHFASKEDLAIATVHRYGDQLGLSTLANTAVGGPRERIEKHFADLVASGLTVAADRGCLMGNLAGEVPAHSPALAAVIGERLEQWVSMLAHVIEEGKSSGELTTSVPSQDLAELLVNAWEGGAVKAKATASSEPVKAFDRMLSHLIF
jgi:TetR/AcrR family transcriptional repressor of nem operon